MRGLAVACLLAFVTSALACGGAGRKKGSASGDAPADPLASVSFTEPGDLPKREGQQVAIRCRLISADGGIAALMERNGIPQPRSMPLVLVALSDGTDAGCVFGDVATDDFRDWRARTAEGTTLAVVGTYQGRQTGTHRFADCRFAVGDFRTRR